MVKSSLPQEDESECQYAQNKFDKATSASFNGTNETASWTNEFHSYESSLKKTHSRFAWGMKAKDYVGTSLIKYIFHDIIYVNVTENLGDFQADGALGLTSARRIDDHTRSFVSRLRDKEVIDNETFSIYFGDQSKQDSYILFGDYTKKLNVSDALFIKSKSYPGYPWTVPIETF
mmetsp:Transcript_13976/g.16196  ORF Transcript_13976/g.16196 Transcript_13976/m.16196 type:complete len:175 (+) Transcript_13976:363-887(+)